MFVASSGVLIGTTSPTKDEVELLTVSPAGKKYHIRTSHLSQQRPFAQIFNKQIVVLPLLFIISYISYRWFRFGMRVMFLLFENPLGTINSTSMQS